MLQDSLDGDAALFIRSDHIEEAWRIVDPLIQGRERLGILLPEAYEPGSLGPRAADGLLSQSGHSWQRVCGVHEGIDG